MVTPQLEKQVKVWHMLAALGSMMLVSAFAWGKAWQANESSVEAIQTKVEQVESRVVAHDDDIKEIRRTTDRTANDVQWMKSWMEKR